MMQLTEPGVAPGRQQAPVVGPQVVLVHWVPGPRKMPPCVVQDDWVARTQVPSGRQQAPELVELEQMEAEQREPGPRQMPPCAWQAD